MDEKTFELIDSLLITDRDHRQTAIQCMDVGERNGSSGEWSEIVGHRFCLNPSIVREWYNERKTRLL